MAAKAGSQVLELPDLTLAEVKRLLMLQLNKYQYSLAEDMVERVVAEM
jgi:hypothetical protein